MTFAKTTEQLLDEHRHEFAGMVVDAMTRGSRDAEASLMLRGLMQKIDRRLKALIEESRREAKTEQPRPLANGAAQPQPRKATA